MAGPTAPWGTAKETTHIAKIGTSAAAGVITAANAPSDSEGVFANVVGTGKLVQADGSTSNRVVNVLEQDDLGQEAATASFQPQGERQAVAVAGVPDIGTWSMTMALTPNDAIHLAAANEGGDGWNIGDIFYVAILGGWTHSTTAPAAGTMVFEAKMELAGVSPSPAIGTGYPRLTLTFAIKSTINVINHGTS